MMAKKKRTLLDAAKATPIAKCGKPRWDECLTPQQRIEFDECLEWYRSLKVGDRPTLKSLVGTIREHFGKAPCVTTLGEIVRYRG